jgi:hypothetical protein
MSARNQLRRIQMSPFLPPAATRSDSNFELSWSQWRANGTLQDAVLHRRAVAAAVLLGCGVATWLAVGIYLG